MTISAPRRSKSAGGRGSAERPGFVPVVRSYHDLAGPVVNVPRYEAKLPASNTRSHEWVLLFSETKTGGFSAPRAAAPWKATGLSSLAATCREGLSGPP